MMDNTPTAPVTEHPNGTPLPVGMPADQAHTPVQAREDDEQNGFVLGYN